METPLQSQPVPLRDADLLTTRGFVDGRPRRHGLAVEDGEGAQALLELPVDLVRNSPRVSASELQAVR